MSEGGACARSVEGQRPSEKRQTFSSSCSSAVTLLGFAVGVGDIWRLPFLIFRNGGGAFLIPFILILFLCGIPLFFLEYSLSKFSGKGPYAIWDISPFFRGTAYSIIIGYSVYNTYISVFRSCMTEFLVNSFQSPLPWSHCNNTWNTQSCREYVVRNSPVESLINVSVLSDAGFTTARISGAEGILNSTASIIMDSISPVINGSIMSAPEEFWLFRVLDLSDGIGEFDAIQWKYVLYHLIFRTMVVACCYKSIKSIEKVMFVSMFGPLLIIICIFIRSMTLPGAMDGIELFFHTDFSKLQEPRVWIEAAIGVFYSLAFGWGALLLLGSHTAFGERTLRTAILVPILDVILGVFNGMVCFSVLGTMAHSLQSRVESVVSASMSVGVISYPSAIAEFPVPQVWSVLFFIALLLQGLDNQVVTIEMIVDVLCDSYPKIVRKRTQALVLVNLVVLLCGTPICTRAGGYLFIFLDWYTGVWLGPIIALMELMVTMWLYGGDRFSYDISLMIGRPIPAIIRIALAFVAPFTVTALFAVSIAEYVPPKYGTYTYPPWIQGLGWGLVVAIFIPTIVHMVRCIFKGNTGILKNLKGSLKPLRTWGPSLTSGVEYYNTQPPKRSKLDLLVFNMLGRYTKRRQQLSDREMEPLS